MKRLLPFFPENRKKILTGLLFLIAAGLLLRSTGGNPFLLKKLFTRLLFPIPFLSMLFLAGVLLLFARSEKKKKAGRFLVTAGTVLFLAAGIFGSLLLVPYRTKYAPWAGPSGKKELHTVCVFGCGWHVNPLLPPEKRMEPEMLCRMYEGALTALKLKEADYPYQIVVSLPDGYPRKDRLHSLRRFYALFGIPPDKVFLLEQGNRNTREELELFRQYSGKKLLVSSPRHLPRILQLAEKQGIRAVPVPAIADEDERIGILKYRPLPDGTRLRNFELFVYETLGQMEVQFLIPRKQTVH